MKVTDAGDKVLFRLEPADGGRQAVYGAGEEPAGHLSLQADRIKLAAPDGKLLLEIRRIGDKGKAQDASGAELFSIKPHSTKAGDFKIEGPGGALLYRMKKESYGYKVTDAQDRTLFKMKAGDGRVVADLDDGTKKMSVKGKADALAACAAGLESFEPLRRAAVYAYLSRFEGGR